MARIVIYAPAATAAGGIRYLVNLLSRLCPARSGDEFIALVSPQFAECFNETVPNLRLVPVSIRGASQHFLWNTIRLGRFACRECGDLILATGGFASPRPPCPQILMNYNALYFSPTHVQVLRQRRLWWAQVEMRLRRAWAYQAMYASTINIVPTTACGDLIASQSKRPIPGLRTIYHGFDPESFLRSAQPLRPSQQAQLDARPRGWRLLLASHYNYFRNFETVLRALAIARRRASRPLELVLTTTLGIGNHDHGYDTTEAARLVQRLQLEDAVIMLGPVSQNQIATLHSMCDAAVSPAYVESFGFPMVEAMGCGRPVIAADTPVHREVCQNAALYFPVFDAEALAESIIRLAKERDLSEQLAVRGKRRAHQFSWASHVRELGECVDECVAGGSARSIAA